MKRAWQWVSLATVLFACNADQFVGEDASSTPQLGQTTPFTTNQVVGLAL